MLKSFREDVLALSAQYPFGVVLAFPERAVVLIPARWSQSNYRNVQILDESSIRKTLCNFRADCTAIDGIRRLLADGTSFANNPNLLSGNQVIEAATAAVVAGHIYAVVAETQPTVEPFRLLTLSITTALPPASVRQTPPYKKLVFCILVSGIAQAVLRCILTYAERGRSNRAAQRSGLRVSVRPRRRTGGGCLRQNAIQARPQGIQAEWLSISGRPGRPNYKG